jgi:hypothetical protein
MLDRALSKQLQLLLASQGWELVKEEGGTGRSGRGDEFKDLPRKAF